MSTRQRDVLRHSTWVVIYLLFILAPLLVLLLGTPPQLFVVRRPVHMESQCHRQSNGQVARVRPNKRMLTGDYLGP